MRERSVDMIHGPLGHKILHMAIPLALTAVIQQFFNAVDIAMVGQFVGKDAMAAVGSNAPILTTLLSLFIGISIGTNVIVAAFIGKGETENVSKSVHTTILVAFLSGLILTAVGELVAPPVLRWLDVPPHIMGMASLYLRVLFCSMPFVLLYNFESSIFRAVGDTRTPLMALVVAGICKIILNLFSLLVLKAGVAGVAAGSTISFIISSALLYLALRKTESVIHVEPSRFAIDGKILWKIMKIGIPAGVQGMVFSLSNLCIQSAINSLGAEAMAATAAAYNVESLAYFLCYAFAQVNTTVVGQNYGAHLIERCRKATRICFNQDMAVTGIITVLVLYFAPQILSFFTSDLAVIRLGTERMYWVIGPLFLNSILDIFAGSMRGFGNSLIPAVMSLVGICGTRITWVYTIFPMKPSLPFLMECYPVSWAITNIFLIAAYFYYLHNLEKER